VRVAIVSECFLPVVNGVTNSVRRIAPHLGAAGHDVLIVAPGDGPPEHGGVPVVRLPSVELPVVTSIPVGVPHRRLLTALRAFRPDVVHLAAPFVVGSAGLAAARRIGAPTVAVYQTDVAGFASSYGLGLTARAAWRWTCRLHAQAARTLAPSSWAIAELRARGVPRVHGWARGVDAARFTPRKRCAALRDAVRRLLDPAVRARFGATARRSVLRRTWSTVGDELIAHYAAVLDGFPVNSDVRAATPGPVSARPHVA